jgi:hypothetical protein
MLRTSFHPQLELRVKNRSEYPSSGTLYSVDHEKTAERLATWLASLGLVEHLEESGMLRLERDDAGSARWVDIGTGEELDEDRLLQVERLLRSHGEEPQHAVPVPLVQAAHLARVRRELLDSEWFTYDTLAELRGASVDATRFAVTRAVSEHRLLGVPTELALLVPAFQLDASGEPRPELADLLSPLLAAGVDPWRVWGWMTRPAALLGGLVPVDAATDPGSAADAVAAAEALARRGRV